MINFDLNLDGVESLPDNTYAPRVLTKDKQINARTQVRKANVI
jgi:hypothetical protein